MDSMHLQSHISKGFVYAIRMLFATILLKPSRFSQAIAVLALVLASLGSAEPAQATQITTFVVNVLNPTIVICTNRSHTYRVQILTTTPTGTEALPEQEVDLIDPGTTISVTDSNPGLGQFTSSTFNLSPLPGSGLTRPDTALFTYTAGDKAGKTTFVFSAGSPWFDARPFPINVTIQPCRFDVIAKSKFFAAYAGGSTLTAVALAKTNENGLAADENGVYRGEANVTWLAVARIPGCGYQSMIAVSKVKLDGFLVGDTELDVRLNYLPAAFTEVIPCKSVGTGGSAGGVVATPVDVTVPIAGGSATPTEQNITSPNLAKGTASVWVIEIKGSAGR